MAPPAGGPDGAGARTRPTPAPSGVTLLELVGELESAGWSGQFQAVEGASLRCLTCRTTFAAAAEHAESATRVEGASDPADMAIVVALRCPNCDAQGSLVARYGPGASTEEAEALTALQI